MLKHYSAWNTHENAVIYINTTSLCSEKVEIWNMVEIWNISETEREREREKKREKRTAILILLFTIITLRMRDDSRVICVLRYRDKNISLQNNTLTRVQNKRAK